MFFLCLFDCCFKILFRLVLFCFFIYILLLANDIAYAGVSCIAEALKVNNTLKRIDFWSE